ncbi:PARP10 [Branchiostoma lanceolatum]|uniref:Poly [ADP-ribose] polymerase n=1 Tax=Branchiostoma lanceolatum TaxID=7740 RepID=A0A8K0EGJ3_BRALA|nr:PARP10 [Branchiostoma lanceolatum]
MGAGASKGPKKADKDSDGPPTFTEPTAPPPAFNPEYGPEAGSPQPQPHPQPPLYPQLQPQPFSPPQFPPSQPFPPPQPYPQPPPGHPGAPYQPGPPDHSGTYAVPLPRRETTFVPQPQTEPVIPVVQSPHLPNEYLLETPSIEVVRTGESAVNTDALKKYFSNNKKSHGGTIASITEDDDCYVINFEDIEVAQDVLSHAHVLKGTTLQVRHRKSPTVKVITGGPIDEDHLRVYFKNKRNGGGPIDGDIRKDSYGVYYITFKSKRDAENILQRPQHSIDGTELVVSSELSQIDHKSLLIKDIPQGCSSSLLQDYLEGLESAQNKLFIASVFRGDDKSKAVVSLGHPIDGQTRNLIAKEAKREPIKKGQHVSVSPMVVTRSVQLSGINKKFTRDLLLHYFENTERSGGDKVLDITMDQKKGTAIIRFKDPTVVQKVVSKPLHEFQCGKVSVFAHYDVLGIITETEFSSSSTTTVGPNVPRVIKRNELKIADVEPQKLCLLEQQLSGFQAAFPNVEFDLNHEKREVTMTGSDNEPQHARDNVKDKLDKFKECRWSISDELKSIISRGNTKKAIEIGLAEANVQKDVHVTVENNKVVICGVDESTADTAENCVKSLFKESIRNIPKEILHLNDWDDLMKKSNKDANDNASMSCDKNSSKVEIVGLVDEVEAIEGKLDDFLKQHSFDTSYVRLEKPIVNVLLKRQTDRLGKIEKENDFSILATTTKTAFKITGPRDRINKVADAIKDLASKVMKIKEQYKKPGLGKLFKEDTFQKLLKGVETDQGCALTWDFKTQSPSPLVREKTSLKDLHHTKPSDGSQRIGPITVDVQQGNIDSESADVIVNPVTDTAAFTVVGDALIRAGGQSIKKEYEKDWTHRSNGVLLTGSGTLRCRKVAHMEVPQVTRLKDAVCQCLVLSNQAGMRSIAFPAIGTGKSGMKPSESAKAIRDGIEQYVHQNPAPTLTHIKLTIFVQKMVADYKAEFYTPTGSGVPSATTGNITTPSPGQQEMSFGSVKLQVQQGDICKERTDVVVSTVEGDMGFTVVTKALVAAGGQSIADELKKAWPSRTGDCVFTGAGKLSNKKVSHMVLPSASDLKDSVVSCLKAADNLGMKSISFPAIGTGGMMSQLESAKGIYSGVQEFSSQSNPRNLHLVRVAIFDSKMLRTFHSTMQQYSKPGNVPGSGHIGSVAVQIQQGDLAKETTDAVVNPVDSDGGFFAIGRALGNVAGAVLKTDCQSSWNQRQNDVLMTDGGNLPCKKVIHTVCPNATTMKERVHECLLQAERNGLKSVSFPAIGTGGVGVSVADAARETVQGIKDFAITRSPRNVKLVRVTVFQAQMVAEFQQALQAATTSAAHPAPLPPRAAAKMTPKTDVEQVVEVTFYACNKQDLDNAKREVSKTIDSYMTKGRVDDDSLKATIRHLQQHEKDGIFQMGADYLVHVTITGQHIEMFGLKDDVAAVLKEIEVFLQKKQGAFEKDQLEKDIIKAPDFWATPPPGVTGAYMHQLHETSSEYKTVERNFLSSVGSHPQIVSICRVQNEAKYRIYMSELKERQKTCTRSNIEERLYHGTAEEVVDNINQGGFNRSFCGKNATVYGKGVYFAKNASYSAQDVYTPPNAQGNKHIYQARVIVGEYTTGKYGIVEPPPKNPANAVVRYDSVVDNEQNPSIFVVFHDTEAYPEYLIVFK